MGNLSLYFVVVFWGRQHRELFLEFLLPSLLSMNNIPALPRHQSHCFLISTTDDDWDYLKRHPGFLHCQNLIKMTHLTMNAPASQDNKYLIMSQGHLKATKKIFSEGACGIFLTPDLVLSDGSVSRLYQLASQGKKVVLCAAMRFSQEPILSKIKMLRENNPEGGFSFPARVLADMAIRHMHVETRRYDYYSPFFAERPISFFFRTPDQKAILVHSFSWAPLLVNYHGLSKHCEETFKNWTMDGDYIFRNFPNREDIYVVEDSDEIFLLSVTPQGDFLGYLSSNLFLSQWFLCLPILKDYWKIHVIRSVRDAHDMDPLKRSILSCGVRIHSQKMTDGDWIEIESQANKILEKVSAPPSVQEKILVLLLKVIQKMFFRVLSLFQLAREGEMFSKPQNMEFTNQAGVNSIRVLLLGPKIKNGRWYWEVSFRNISEGKGKLGETASIGVVGEKHSLVRELGSQKHGWGWRGDGKKVHAGKQMAFGSVPNKVPEIIMVALDMQKRELWFGRNGEWFESGDPAIGKNSAFQRLNATLFPAISSKHGGQGTATMESCVSEDRLVYSPPIGFQPLALATPF